MWCWHWRGHRKPQFHASLPVRQTDVAGQRDRCRLPWDQMIALLRNDVVNAVSGIGPFGASGGCG